MTPPVVTKAIMTLPEFLGDVCSRFAARECLVFGKERWTYRDVFSEAMAIGGALAATGTARYSRVGILMGERPEAVTALYGASMAGAVAVPIPCSASPSEIRVILGSSGVDVVLADSQNGERDYAVEIRSLFRQLPFLRRVVALHDEWDGWDEFVAFGVEFGMDRVAARSEEVTPIDPAIDRAAVTAAGRPKVVTYSQKSVTSQFWLQARLLGESPESQPSSSANTPPSADDAAIGATLATGGCLVMRSRTPVE